MQILLRINHYLGKVEAFILAISVILMALLLISNVFFRFFMSISITFAEELCKFGLITITYIGVSYTLRHNSQVEMTAIINRLPTKYLRWAKIITQILTAVILILISLVCFQYVQSVQNLNRVTPALEIPLWITLLGLPVGLLLGGFQSILAAILNIIDKENVWVGSETKEGQNDGLESYTLPNN